MEKYVYSIICAYLSVIWLLIYYKRTDLRKKIIKASLMSSVAGVLIEFWYLNDYWHPPTIFENIYFPVEDMICGFMITGISISIYDFIFKPSLVYCGQNKKKHFWLLFLFGFFSLLI